MKKLIAATLLCGAGLLGLPAAQAKDRPSLAAQVGAAGSEKTFTRSSDVAADYTVEVPYTRTTFAPCVHVGADVPVADISARSFFNVKAGYDFTWQGAYTPATDASPEESSAYRFWHTISLLPELTFCKGNLRFSVGTGLSFDIMTYDYDANDSPYHYERDYTIYQLLWTSELGVKYYLSKHFAAMCDLSLSVSFMKNRKDGDYSKRENGTTVSGGQYSRYENTGNEALSFRPRAGLCYTF